MKNHATSRIDFGTLRRPYEGDVLDLGVFCLIDFLLGSSGCQTVSKLVDRCSLKL